MSLSFVTWRHYNRVYILETSYDHSKSLTRFFFLLPFLFVVFNVVVVVDVVIVVLALNLVLDAVLVAMLLNLFLLRHLFPELSFCPWRG
jgi:hypothetical protein